MLNFNDAPLTHRPYHIRYMKLLKAVSAQVSSHYPPSASQNNCQLMSVQTIFVHVGVYFEVSTAH